MTKNFKVLRDNRTPEEQNRAQALAQKYRAETETLDAIRKRFEIGNWTRQDLDWLYNQANAATRMLEALQQIICPDCEHPLGQHVDKYGCEFDRGDRQVQDVGAVTIGPCGCQGNLLSDDLKNCLDVLKAR